MAKEYFEKTLDEIRKMENYKNFNYELKELPSFLGRNDYYFSVTDGKKYICASRFLSRNAAFSFCREVGIEFNPKMIDFV